MTVNVQAGKDRLETITPEVLKGLIADFCSKLEDPETRGVLGAVFGGDAVLEAFSQSSSVGIGAFAKLVDLPVSTVRHYIELGLVRPYLVNGKFKFVPPNVTEVHSVRQWADLGLTLEEIVQRLEKSETVSGVLPGFSSENGRVQAATFQMIRLTKPPRDASEDVDGRVRVMSSRAGIQPLLEELRFDPKTHADQTRQEIAAQIEQLEQKQADITAKLERARGLKAQLEPQS